VYTGDSDGETPDSQLVGISSDLVWLEQVTKKEKMPPSLQKHCKMWVPFFLPLEIPYPKDAAESTLSSHVPFFHWTLDVTFDDSTPSDLATTSSSTAPVVVEPSSTEETSWFRKQMNTAVQYASAFIPSVTITNKEDIETHKLSHSRATMRGVVIQESRIQTKYHYLRVRGSFAENPTQHDTRVERRLLYIDAIISVPMLLNSKEWRGIVARLKAVREDLRIRGTSPSTSQYYWCCTISSSWRTNFVFDLEITWNASSTFNSCSVIFRPRLLVSGLSESELLQVAPHRVLF